MDCTNTVTEIPEARAPPIDSIEVPSPRGELAGGSATSNHTARETTLGTIAEEKSPRLPAASPELRTVKKTPSYRDSARFSRRKLPGPEASTNVLVTQSSGRDHDVLTEDSNDNSLDKDVIDDEADDSFDLEVNTDDEYDTDLEMDIDQWLREGRVQLQDDVTGQKAYEAACLATGVTPTSYFIRHIEDREVVMRFHGLGPLGTRALCTPLKANNTLEKLDLEGNWIQHPGCVSVADMLTENIYLSDLILSENKIGSEGVVALCYILCKNDVINKLDLSGNDLTDSAAEAICDMLKKNTTLKHLILRHNYFEERGAHQFKDALSTNESLETMDLSWNRFRTRSAMLIAEGIQENYGLRCLNFAMNGLGQDGAECMGKALKTNRTLLQLDISFNRIPEMGAGYIAMGLQTNDVLQGLKISSNPIGTEGAMVLILAVDRNDSSCLNYLELINIRVNEEFRDMEQKLKDERDLVVIHSGYNFEGSFLPEPQKVEPDDWWIRDPMTKLKKYVKENGYRLIDLFRDFDKDNNNTISREEFIVGVQNAGIRLTDTQIDELISKMDKDGNGCIDYSELLEGDREYRILRRQWAEAKRQQEKKFDTPRSGQEPLNVRDLLETKEVLLPEQPTANPKRTSETATVTN